MLDVPLALRLEANKLVQTRPWLVLLELTLPDASILRLVRNTDDIPYNGYTWTAFPFTVDVVGESGDGKVQQVVLRASNVGQALTPYLEANDGLVGCQVRLITVHEGSLAEDYASLTLAYDIVATRLPPGATWVEFTLGAENPMRRRFPPYAAVPLHCQWVANFKGAECKYAGADATCSGSLTACRLKNNSANFGGRPGITGAPRFV